MYRNDDYLALAHLSATELQNEKRKAQETIEYYQAYADKPLNKTGTLPPLQPIIEKIKSCENYIIEIERRLGRYSRNVGQLLFRMRNKKVQLKGINFAPGGEDNYAPASATRPVMLPAKMSASSKKRAKINAIKTPVLVDIFD